MQMQMQMQMMQMELYQLVPRPSQCIRPDRVSSSGKEPCFFNKHGFERKKERSGGEGRGGLVVLVLVTMIDKFELLPFWFPSFLVFSITYRNLFSGVTS